MRTRIQAVPVNNMSQRTIPFQGPKRFIPCQDVAISGGRINPAHLFQRGLTSPKAQSRAPEMFRRIGVCHFYMGRTTIHTRDGLMDVAHERQHDAQSSLGENFILAGRQF
ncbi:MAG: hypothetical protein OXC82_02610 [Rhodobacteraceae bacterium]|nr:hypothetical protein [Paracoccaceae bacterium]MCY4249315.1 hypothetical protein [Paracoccaceae bacterium]